MIYIERTIKIKKGEASIDEPVCLYKGDKNIEIRFLIENNPFKYKNDLTINYGQLIIKRENAPDIFSEPTKLNSGRVVFLITGEMIDDLNELGNYTFQIRILNEDLTSRGTLPPVFAGISIKEPLCEEPLEPPPPTIYDVRYNGGTDCSYLFYNYGAESLDLNICDVSNITNMYGMFYNCNNLISLNLSNWNTSNVTNMYSMFYNCYNLTTIGDISGWDTSNVIDMERMFYNCNNLTELNLSNWNTSNVTNMYAMFSECESLTTLDISNWNTSKVTDMRSMFQYCNNLTTLNLSSLSIGIKSLAAMFDCCYALTSLDISNWNTNHITNINRIFGECSKLTTIIGELDASNLINGFYNSAYGNVFIGCKSLETVYLKNIYKNVTMTNESKWSINLGATIVKDECLISIINELPNLYDKGLTTTDKIIFTLPKTNTLTAEQVQVAVDKGWSVANTTY